MKIFLSPQRRDDTLSVVRRGDLLIVNDEPFDFPAVEEGDILPRSAIESDWFAGDVTRVNGELELTLILPNPANFSQAQAFPVPLTITKMGQLSFPGR
ncbi:hypothetical protein GHO42_15530 [Pseudomonas sp. FSL R10-0056]|uniref:hypothetical protein n=1 Tax=unclassified Pseudomonas TaxID=196821 RepID=UPI001294CB94|nr:MULTISPECIES: hypothetical protein [unclassified Pseudomonas]MQT64485.1 hypothetical protein [Pseudomonas sp. FSL R10-0056]MQT70168.1 hypothetical protein [Pseudomonas sp. FSL R10-0071]MQU49265.1 hypothetical protein [Pseudomonas sp. FSL A6-1183]